jgi:hypothetical protein
MALAAVDEDEPVNPEWCRVGYVCLPLITAADLAAYVVQLEVDLAEASAKRRRWFAPFVAGGVQYRFAAAQPGGYGAVGLRFGMVNVAVGADNTDVWVSGGLYYEF